ncbi:MAG: GNAT family N-acetyltransferase [Acidobacteriota bacterium]|nr:GNAT family N-acetyltransferase [Acidobacteriota bacterium]
MIEQAHGLTDSALEAIANLERRVVAADGGRLKLEWGTLRNRPADAVQDLLWWDGERLLGFLGIYGFSRDHLELTGMVDPETRRRGIARALLEAALPLCRGRGKGRLLLVVPRSSPGGGELARAYGMTLEHSEHALTLSRRPLTMPTAATLDLRAATLDDIQVLSRLYDDGFDDGGHVDPSRLTSDRARTLLIVREHQAVGTIAVSREGARSAIYAFVVGCDWRGQGIGREALRRVCQDQFDTGATQVELEVEVENERALGLYTSVGFEALATEDYYELIL